MVLNRMLMNHTSVTLPIGVVRDVFAREHTDALLHLLSTAEGPLLYTHARDAIRQRPEEFRRSLIGLERWGLVQLRVVPRDERPDARRRVRLELTALGHAVKRLHDDMDASWRRIARSEGLAPEAFALA